MLIDTHCHIHDFDYPLSQDQVIDDAKKTGVKKMICIGTDVDNSKQALLFADKREGIFASVGVHPNNCLRGIEGLEFLIKQKPDKLVAIGEIGLDYHYGIENRENQIELFKKQLDLAVKYDLPVIFHVREAFDDFWKIFDEFKNNNVKIRGVLHSFTDSNENLKRAIKEGLFIGVNGFSTFTKDSNLMSMYSSLPLNNMILETDAPYLTPKPFRGKINEPAYVGVIANYHSLVRNITVEDLAKITTTNANKLFNI